MTAPYSSEFAIRVHPDRQFPSYGDRREYMPGMPVYLFFPLVQGGGECSVRASATIGVSIVTFLLSVQRSTTGCALRKPG